jgi:hypothetical protein
VAATKRAGTWDQSLFPIIEGTIVQPSRAARKIETFRNLGRSGD